ncbi:MAG TPA: hypothetical protein PKC28_12585, partial [Bdellovibrionales bacterium]|nr:hypothetical protein [Bdellovibrionales bacterium]
TIKRFDLCKKGRLENTHLAIEVQLLDGDGMRTSTFSAFAQASNTRKGMAEKQVVKAAVAEIAKRVKKALDRSMNLQSAINQSDYNLELRRKPASER